MYLRPACHFKSENLEEYLGGLVTQIGTMPISIISVYYFALSDPNGSLKSASERSCTETLKWLRSTVCGTRASSLNIRIESVYRTECYRKYVEMCPTFSGFKLSCDRQTILVHECHIRTICKCVLRVLQFDWLIG